MSIIPRAAWHAKEPLSAYEPLGTVSRITVHRSEGPNAQAEAVAPTLRAMQHYHQHERVQDEKGEWIGAGFIDIAYHYLISGDGLMWEGRPAEASGSHCKGQNHGNIGVCLLGKNHFTPLQTAALAALLEMLIGKHDLPAEVVQGHRDVPPSNTDCPGDELSDWLALWRSQRTKESTP